MGERISLSVTGTVPTTLLAIVGVGSLDLGVRNEVSRSVTKLRVALVLDNTGSMSQNRRHRHEAKFPRLKTATHQLLTQLQNIAVNPGDVQVSIVSLLARREYRNRECQWRIGSTGRIGKMRPTPRRV